MVVDHHRVMANFETANSLMMRLEPVGSSFFNCLSYVPESMLEVPKEVAGLLCQDLISDTLLLKSPTTHASRSCSSLNLQKLLVLIWKGSWTCYAAVLIFAKNLLKNLLILIAQKL